MKRLPILLGLLLVIVMTTSGCFYKKEVQASQVGLELSDGVSVSDFHSAGRYTNMSSWYAELIVVDVTNKTVLWQDPSLVTKDKQPISFSLSITYQRCRDEASVVAMFNDYRSELLDDTTLQTLVLSRVPSAAKQVTTEYSLDEMLGIAETGEVASGRQVVENALQDLLKPELASVYVCLTNVTIADIGVDEAYLEALSLKAQAQIAAEVAVAQTQTLQQKLEQEVAQTNIDLEIARRQNLVNEEIAKAYNLNPSLVEIRKLELLAEIFDENDMIIYVPSGSDISTVLLGGESGVVPVNPSQP